MEPVTTADLGDRFPANGSSGKHSPPTGHQTASAVFEPTPAVRGKRPPDDKLARRRRARTQALVDFDRKLGSDLVAGADEAGRGCLAGPLVAAAVLIDYRSLTRAERRRLTGLDDSKRLDPVERERLFAEVMQVAVRVCVVTRCSASIDRRGLHRCNLEALAAALEGLSAGEAGYLVDGFRLPECAVEHRKVVKGDSTSAAIAAASVIAKVTRDRQMVRLDRQHPGWGFGEHVGYATAAHRAAIERLGPSPVHRLSFASSAYAAFRRQTL